MEGQDNVPMAEEDEDSPHESESDVDPPTQPSNRSQSKTQNSDEKNKLFYRELQRQAYSPASLHHFKSGRGGSSARGVRPAARGVGRIDNKGKGGQPDMRLRMNALLEKIKYNVLTSLCLLLSPRRRFFHQGGVAS